MTYTLLHSSVLLSGTGPNPWGPPAIAILSDGTFLVASEIQDTLESVRLWHLADDLSVLGSTDIAMGASDRPTPYLVATGMHAVLITRVAFSPATYATYLVDATGPNPSVGPAVWQSTSVKPAYEQAVMFHVYDLVTNRIVILSDGNSPSCSVLQVFDSTTGALLSEAVAIGSSGYPVGLYMNPADHTKFAGYDASPQRLNFTVALDGSSCFYDGITTIVGGGAYSGAVGSPYIPGGPGLIAESFSPVLGVNFYAADGSVSASYAMVGSEYVNLFGPSVTLADSSLILYLELANAADASAFDGFLIAVDQSVVPATMEHLSLPYPVSGYSYVFDIAHMDVDQSTGIILIGAMLYDFGAGLVSSVLWVVQGPVMTPNLTGQLLEDRVRFT
jgi:hypothetical protein